MVYRDRERALRAFHHGRERLQHGRDGNPLERLASRKFLTGLNSTRRYHGAEVKRQAVTAVECVSVDGKALNPLIVWPTSTHRSVWTTHPIPKWHFACSDNWYANHDIILSWYRHVFDPQTRERANGRPRILINDGFGPHEPLEVMQFCHDNNIVLRRLPSHTSHKLQPCDVGVF